MHRHNGKEIAPERHYVHHPIDDIEREDLEEIKDAQERADRLVRAAKKECVRILNLFGSHIDTAILRPGSTKVDVAVAFYSVGYALGLNICEGKTMTERAEIWGVERATISKGAVQFTSAHKLPPSYYMKQESARGAYADARILSISENQ